MYREFAEELVEKYSKKVKSIAGKDHEEFVVWGMIMIARVINAGVRDILSALRNQRKSQ